MKRPNGGPPLHLFSLWGVMRTGVGVGVVAVVVTSAALAWSAGTPALIKMKQPQDAEMSQVVFRHWKHQKAYKCYTCHPRIFSSWEKATFDHDAMDGGKFCGACHNGKVAFKPESDNVDCEVCHVE